MTGRGPIGVSDGHISAELPDGRLEIPLDRARKLLLCSMADPLSHGEEIFYILVLDESFLLVGPFVTGGEAAIETAIETADIPVERRLIGHVPYCYREKGLFGLRAFPIPGLGYGPLADLRRFDLMTPSGETIETIE